MCTTYTFYNPCLKADWRMAAKTEEKQSDKEALSFTTQEREEENEGFVVQRFFFPLSSSIFFFFFLSDWKLILSLTCLLLLCLRTALSPVLCLLIALLNEHHQCKVFHLSVQFGREEEAFSKERIILPRHNKELSYVVLFSYLQDCTAGVWFHVCVTVKWTVICYTREKRQT